MVAQEIVASRNGRSRNGRVRNGLSRIGRSRIGTSTGAHGWVYTGRACVGVHGVACTAWLST